jgi:hypothetical protein
MAYAIMRCAKKSSMGAVARSLKHCFREAPTPNADPTRTHENKHGCAKSTEEAMGRLRELLPEKRRKDAVVCVEYLMTASPEWWKQASPQQQMEFFKRAAKWLSEKYGQENILVATIHRDETSPHLSAFVVPLTKDKRLSAKEFIGNKIKMSDDQTSFAEKMKDLGLERGIKGSKARHQTIREYYALANSVQPLKTPEIDVPEPKMLETKATYGNRVAQATIDAINPTVMGWQAKAAAAAKRIEAAELARRQAEQQVKAAESQKREAEQRINALKEREKKIVENLNMVVDDRKSILKIVVNGGLALEQLREKVQKMLRPKAQEPERRGPSR